MGSVLVLVFFLYVAGFENRVQSILSAPEPILEMMEKGENKTSYFVSFCFV